MRRLRVLSVINTLHFGGDECRLFSLAKEIDRDRFEHTVLTLKRADPSQEQQFGSLRPHFEAANIEVCDLSEDAPQLETAHGTALNVARSIPRLARTLNKLTAYIRANDIEIIDAHIGTANEIGTAAALLTRTPVVITTYQLEPFHPLWLHKSSERLVFAAVSAIITDSEAVAAQIQHKLLRPRKIAVIPNGIEPPISSRTRSEMHAKFGIPLNACVRVIGQVSSLTPRKGHLILLDAAHTVIRQEPNVHFLICGYARPPYDYECQLHARTAELGIRDRVHFVGYPGQIGDVYRAIDIQVHASTAESLPQAIIEGMAAAKPAVVTDVAGIPSMVTDGETGLMVPPADADALANALLRLLHDPDMATRLGNAARERYFSRYTQRHMARSLEDLFLEVAR